MKKSSEASCAENKHLVHTHNPFRQALVGGYFKKNLTQLDFTVPPWPWAHSPCTDIYGRAACFHCSPHSYPISWELHYLLNFDSFIQVEHQTFTFQTLRNTYQRFQKSLTLRRPHDSTDPQVALSLACGT